MDGGKKPGKKKRQLPPLRIVKTVPLKPDPSQHNTPVIDKDAVKRIFMASKHIEWTPFAQSMAWDPVRSRTEYPSQTWIMEKKQILAQQQAEEIAEMVFDHRSRWHKDVLTTLKEYPSANDAMLGVLKHRLNEMIQTINTDGQKKVLHAQEQARDPSIGPYRSDFSQIKNSELLSLSIAIKTVTESKHRSLLLGDWSVKLAEQYVTPEQLQNEDHKVNDTSWSIEVMGGNNLDAKDFERLMFQYLDKPQAPPQLQELPEAPISTEPPPDET